jgi:hypothetical protein
MPREARKQRRLTRQRTNVYIHQADISVHARAQAPIDSSDRSASVLV